MDSLSTLSPEKQVITLINYFFNKERNGNIGARDKAAKKLLEFLIETDDGSYTLKSDNSRGDSENMHTSCGAITESMEKFVKPFQFKIKSPSNIKILDICSGLGYNSAALVEYLVQNSFLDNDLKLSIDMIEISIETLAAGLLVPSPLESHYLVKKAIEEKLIEDGFAKFKLEKADIPFNIQFNIFSHDARDVVVNLESNQYDAIFLDPFSPSKAPELYSIDFFKELKQIIKKDGIIITYTSAAPVRSAMVEAGFHIGEGPAFGRKSGGTIASLLLDNIKKDISEADERMIALSDAGIPFRDPSLDLSGELILKNRSIERELARGKYKLSSAVKTPIYLGKELEMNRLGRRVLRNLNNMAIDDFSSKKAFYLVCCQNESCYCGCNINKISNSRDRIKKMSKRMLNIVNSVR